MPVDMPKSQSLSLSPVSASISSFLLMYSLGSSRWGSKYLDTRHPHEVSGFSSEFMALTIADIWVLSSINLLSSSLARICAFLRYKGFLQWQRKLSLMLVPGSCSWKCLSSSSGNFTLHSCTGECVRRAWESGNALGSCQLRNNCLLLGLRFYL